MLTDRDMNILDWLDKYKAITIEQAQYMFFNESYEAARRRLSLLEEYKILKSYISKATKKKIYYIEKKISDHDLYCLDYIKELKKLGCEIITIIPHPHYKLIIPDFFVKFKLNKYIFNTLLEVDFTHNTPIDKLNILYEKLAKETDNYSEFNNQSFILILAKTRIQLMYSAKNFTAIYTDLKYSNLNNLLGLDEFRK